MISIAGALSTAHQDRDAFQEVDQQALFAPITKKTWTVPSADRVPEIFREAFRTALAPRRLTKRLCREQLRVQQMHALKDGHASPAATRR